MKKYELFAQQKSAACVPARFPMLKTPYEQWSKIRLLDLSGSSGKTSIDTFSLQRMCFWAFTYFKGDSGTDT